MSFQNYDGFQGQPGQQDPSGGAPPQQDTSMSGGMPDPGQQYQGGNSGDPGSAGGQQGADSKTTLW